MGKPSPMGSGNAYDREPYTTASIIFLSPMRISFYLTTVGRLYQAHREMLLFTAFTATEKERFL